MLGKQLGRSTRHGYNDRPTRTCSNERVAARYGFARSRHEPRLRSTGRRNRTMLGKNFYGQLGDGTTTQRLIPTQVLGIGDAVDVVAGDAHTCVRHNTGKVSCWGDNAMGQLGDGTGEGRSACKEVPGIFGATMIAGGQGHVCVL